MIRVDNLAKKYGELWALKETSWSVGPKKTLGLLGPNGAGKSTTMKILTGLLKPTQGEVFVDETPIAQNPIAQRKKMGYLPEIPPLYKEMRVKDYLHFCGRLRGLEAGKVRQQVDQIMERVHIVEVERRYIGKLSKGFRQRVGLAQALVGDTSILILDEPSVGLDPQQVVEFRKLIVSLKNDYTIVLSTHILSEVQQICDDVVILNKGETQFAGSIDQVLQKIDNRFGIKMVLNKIPQSFLEKVRNLPNVKSIGIVDDGKAVEIFSNRPIDSIDPFIEKALEFEIGILNVEKYQTQLEDAYMEITQPRGEQQ